MNCFKKESTVAIGGLGGSGTRIFSKLIQLHDFHLGEDLNEAEDNLFFTLLFKRLSALLENDYSFNKLANIFFAALQGDNRQAVANKEAITALAYFDRMGHSKEWLLQRAEKATVAKYYVKRSRWGWKEPNTHILIERFLKLNQELKYIHVIRDPFYMAYSNNQNQLCNWGSLFFDTKIEISPRNALTFWIKTYQRIHSMSTMWPGRILIVRYEDLYSRLAKLFQEIEDFLEIKHNKCIVSEIRSLIRLHSLTGRPSPIDVTIFRKEDIDYISQNWGYTNS